MSASGAVAAALCISEIVGGSRKEAFEAAHTADAVCGGGLGDVSGLMHEWDVPIRTEAGLPPFGCAKDHKIEFERLTLIVIGGDMSTAGILADSGKLESICKAGEEAMRRFEGSPGKDQLFDISNKFSSEACLRGKEVAGAMQELENNGMRASMCMLGNSIFTDASEKEVRDAVGDAYWIFSTASTAEPARIIRKA